MRDFTRKSWTERKALTKDARQHVDPKLRRSLRLFLVISAVLLAVVIYETIRDHTSVGYVALGLIAGISVGILLSRMYEISWDHGGQRATYRIDIIGGIVLVLYVLFSFFRSNLVGFFVQGQSVAAISMAVLAGGMFGRVLGSGRMIVRVLSSAVWDRT